MNKNPIALGVTGMLRCNARSIVDASLVLAGSSCTSFTTRLPFANISNRPRLETCKSSYRMRIPLCVRWMSVSAITCYVMTVDSESPSRHAPTGGDHGDCQDLSRSRVSRKVEIRRVLRRIADIVTEMRAMILADESHMKKEFPLGLETKMPLGRQRRGSGRIDRPRSPSLACLIEVSAFQGDRP
nr:hypothetical protein CFP56_53745 [Quercus suber]